MLTHLVIRQFSTVDNVAVLEHLVAESEQEGFHFLRRLRDEYESASNRFDRPGEGLFLAWLGDRPVGTCGLNRDPYAQDDTIGRVRRLYVHPSVRHRGVGRSLVAIVVARARESYRILRLRTENPAADAFYRSWGFSAVQSETATHVLSLEKPPNPDLRL